MRCRACDYDDYSVAYTRQVIMGAPEGTTVPTFIEVGNILSANKIDGVLGITLVFACPNCGTLKIQKE